MTTDIETTKPFKKLGDGKYAVQSYTLLPDGKSAIATGFGTCYPFLVNLTTGDVKPIGSLSSYGGFIKDGSGNDMKFRNVNHLTSLPLPDGRIVMNDGYTLRSLTQDGDGVISVETIAGCDKKDAHTDGKALEEARFNFISALAYNPVDGSIIIADNYRIRKLNKEGIVSTVAGSGKQRKASYSYMALPDDFDDVLPALECSFSIIQGVAVLSDGTILVADSEKLRQISVDGMVSTIANFDRHIDGLLVDGDDNIYTCVVRFEDEDEPTFDDHNPKTSTAVVKVNAVTKTVVDVVPFGSRIDCGRLISFTKEGHLLVADCSGICHIVKTSCRMVQNKIQQEREKEEEEKEEEQVAFKDETVVMRRSKRLAVLNEERVARRRRRSQRLAALRDSCV
jgi:hypothetical protein